MLQMILLVQRDPYLFQNSISNPSTSQDLTHQKKNLYQITVPLSTEPELKSDDKCP